MDEFTQIKTFIEVVEAGSFSRAARGTSISAITRRVQSLEEGLGVRLLNRNTRGLSLTDAGRHFYERVTGISSELSSAISEVKSLQHDVKGLLRVSLRAAAATTMIVPALPMLLARHPDLRLEVIVTDEKRDLIANNIDVAVWIEPLPDSVVARRLSASRRIVCGTPAYFGKHGIPLTPQNLRQHNCLLYTPIFTHSWNFTRNGEHESVKIGGSFSADNGLALLAAALADIGIVVVFEWMARDLIAAGRMTQVLAEYTVNPYPGAAELFAVWTSSRGMSRKVRVFVDFLVELFSDQKKR
jgi:DNA-binding transcriptional LysR family regulator